MSVHSTGSDCPSSDISRELTDMITNHTKQKQQEELTQLSEIVELNRQKVQQKIAKEINKIQIGYDQINIYHLKQNGMYNEEEEKFKKLQRYSTISEVEVHDLSNLPFELKVEKQLQQLFEEQIMKQWENKNHFNSFRSVCQYPCFIELTRQIFWLTLFLKYPSTCANPNILKQIRETISYEYTLLNTLVPQPKDELMKPVVFVMAYACQRLMFDMFYMDRRSFDVRMVLDCFHIAINEIYGILTTDFFIQNSLDHYFSVKFEDSERTGKFPELYKKNRGGQERGREFLGTKIEPAIPNNKEQMEFYQEIKNILAIDKKPPTKNKKNRKQHLSRHQSETESSNCSMSINGSQTSLHKKQGKNQMSSLKPKNKASKNPNQKAEMISEDNCYKNENIDDMYKNLSPSLGIKNSGRDITYNRLRFNLNQVSPTVSKQIELRDCTLQEQRKQIIFHPIDRCIKYVDYINELEIMKQQSNKKLLQIEKIVRQQHQQQLMNSEQMRLQLLKGDHSISIPSLDKISSFQDLSGAANNNNHLQKQQSPSQTAQKPSDHDLTKKIMMLRIFPKKKDEELTQAQKFKIQYQSVKEIKSFIDTQGSRVVDLPSTIQFFQSKRHYQEEDEEEEQRIKILNRLQERQIIQSNSTSENGNDTAIKVVSFNEKNLLKHENSILNKQDKIIKQIRRRSTESSPKKRLVVNTLKPQLQPSQQIINRVQYKIEEKQKLDSSVQFLVKEQEESQTEQNNKSSSSLQKQYKILSTRQYKDKYNQVPLVMQQALSQTATIQTLHS